MDLSHSSCWDAILETVKTQIPTIDFDSSSSENEEIVTIYQRPAGLSLKVPEDFDSFSIDDYELEELSKPLAETCSQTVQLDNEIVEGTAATRWDTQHFDSDDEEDAFGRGTVESSGASLDFSVKPNMDNTKSDKGFQILSFARLDQWDLDNVLQNLKEDGQRVSVEPVKTNADGDKDSSHRNIMERLVAYCKGQSSQFASEPLKSPSHIRQNNMWNTSLDRMAAELQKSHEESPTVYIDLSCPHPSVKPQRTSPDLSSESRLRANHNTPRETPPAKKSNLKVHTGSRTEDREVTGKSMLLQKIRENRNGNKYPGKDTAPPYSVLGNEAIEPKKMQTNSVGSTCSHQSHHRWEDRITSHVQSEDRHSKKESPSATQQSPNREPKQQSDQVRQQVKLTLPLGQHLQILKQLETHRPTTSVNQKQPAAEGCDVLYDFEASHTQSISTLPADIESKGCMLLIVDLSSPGMVGGRAQGRRKHLYPAATKSHIYHTLVAWFLSLVGPDPRQDENQVGAKVPFWVAGLQQLWTEDGLALHVLAVARHCYTPRKRDEDIHTPFYNHVCKFLNETSLTCIAHWIPQINILLDQQAYASSIHLPSSCLNCFISTTPNKKVIDRTFGLSPGFYWQTVETQGHVCKGRDQTAPERHTEVSVALGCKTFFLQPLIAHYTLQLVLDSGLDVCGLRLLYPPQGFLSGIAGAVPVIHSTAETCQAVVALAVRGPHAHSVFKDLTSSLGHLLPRKTDPTSLKPGHSRGQEPPLLHSPGLASQVHRELCLWFSGRLQGGSAHNHSWPLNGPVPLDDRVGGSLLNSSRSLSLLCASTKAELLLVVSPSVPPCCYGQVLSVCERRGFSLRGLQRLQLQSNEAAVLGLSNQQALWFCSPQTVALEQKERELPSHCLVLLLRKENAMHHSVTLPTGLNSLSNDIYRIKLISVNDMEALMREFKSQKLLGGIHSRLDGVPSIEPSHCFHTVPYSSNLSHNFVRSMWTVPDPSRMILSHQKCLSNSDTEQVVILTLCGKDMSEGLSLLHRALTEGPEGDVGFELRGLKCLPALTGLQARELSPYEVGEHSCLGSLDKLMSSSALVCALRRVDAFASLRKLLPLDYPGNLSVLMSPTPQVASRQASLFFFENELIPDQQTLLTVCLFKPRIWDQALARTVRKLQLSGLTVVGLRVVTLHKSHATSLLPAESDPSDSEAHVEYLCSGSSVALCLQGVNAVRRLLDVLDQEKSSLSNTCNGMAHSFSGIYGSGSYYNAIQDVKRLFPEGLCCTETSTMRQEQILSMCSDPLASVEREQTCKLAPIAQESRSPSITSGQNGGSVIHSAPWQTTCLLIPLHAPPLSQAPSPLELLEHLLRAGCHLVAGRMSILYNEQWKHVAETVKVSLKEDKRIAQLTTTPFLIVALQGETILTRFNLILESIYKKTPHLGKVGGKMIYPESEKEAQHLICYLFDALSSESRHNLVPKQF